MGAREAEADAKAVWLARQQPGPRPIQKRIRSASEPPVQLYSPPRPPKPSAPPATFQTSQEESSETDQPAVGPMGSGVSEADANLQTRTEIASAPLMQLFSPPQPPPRLVVPPAPSPSAPRAAPATRVEFSPAPAVSATPKPMQQVTPGLDKPVVSANKSMQMEPNTKAMGLADGEPIDLDRASEPFAPEYSPTSRGKNAEAKRAPATPVPTKKSGFQLVLDKLTAFKPKPTAPLAASEPVSRRASSPARVPSPTKSKAYVPSPLEESGLNSGKTAGARLGGMSSPGRDETNRLIVDGIVTQVEEPEALGRELEQAPLAAQQVFDKMEEGVKRARKRLELMRKI
eukprot:scaffold2399_cov27-Tisochrysis_lutea.AAC.1